MCSASEQEVSQIDTATVTVVFTAVAGTVRASAAPITKFVDDRDYAHNVQT
jgi:hypothetical protein